MAAIRSHRTPVREHGFTLLELLTVIFIIGLLIGILVPSLKRARDNAKRTMCLAKLHGISLALDIYDSNSLPYCGEDQAPPKPCPENLLISSSCALQQNFICPSDIANSYGETAELFGGGGAWMQRVFWPTGDSGQTKYVRYMHNYDLRDNGFSINGMESSYMWEQRYVETRTNYSSVADRIILTDGGHVVNDRTWRSLRSRGPDAARLDQTHLDDTVCVLRAGGRAEAVLLTNMTDGALDDPRR